VNVYCVIHNVNTMNTQCESKNVCNTQCVKTKTQCVQGYKLCTHCVSKTIKYTEMFT
jgi:hypothetical protein